MSFSSTPGSSAVTATALAVSTTLIPGAFAPTLKVCGAHCHVGDAVAYPRDAEQKPWRSTGGRIICQSRLSSRECFMKTNADDEDGEKASTTQWRTPGGCSRLIECPFEVRIDGIVHDQFYDVRDALGSAREVMKTMRGSTVVVIDARTGKLVIEVIE